MKSLKELQDIPLSNFDILKMLNGQAKIILYPNLHKYKSIDDILNPFGSCIILFEAKPKYGHWCALFKLDENTIEFFNPYGGYPDESLSHIDDIFRIISNQFYPYLSSLMYNSKYNLTYNEHQFQKKDMNIKTCGRHCVVRLILKDLSLDNYFNLLNKMCNKINKNYDELVSILTNI
jgi:hypothetical protein